MRGGKSGGHVRLSMCSTLMEYESVSNLKKEMWNRFKAKMMALYKKRHEVAHFSFVLSSADEKQITHIAPFYSDSAFYQDKLKYLDLNQIRERTGKFAELRPAIGWFWVEAQKRRGQLAEYSMPEPPLIARMRVSASQILEARLPPPPPSGKKI